MGFDITGITEGVIVGGVGGACAGLTIMAVSWLAQYHRDCRDGKLILKWLENVSKDEEGNRFRSTRAIASWNNLPMERVTRVCAHHKKIYLSTGEKEGLWSIHARNENRTPPPVLYNDPF